MESKNKPEHLPINKKSKESKVLLLVNCWYLLIDKTVWNKIHRYSQYLKIESIINITLKVFK